MAMRPRPRPAARAKPPKRVIDRRQARSGGTGPGGEDPGGGGPGGDTTPPTITTAAAQTVAENQAFSLTLQANEAVTWAIAGGADAARFSLAGAVLSLSARDYEAPADADGNNSYVVTVRATDAAGNASTLTITVAVSNVNSGGGDPNDGGGSDPGGGTPANALMLNGEALTLNGDTLTLN